VGLAKEESMSAGDGERDLLLGKKPAVAIMAACSSEVGVPESLERERRVISAFAMRCSVIWSSLWL
jgi:hypothetical protein